MKKFTLYAVSLLLALCFLLTGCAKLENPASFEVTSNGGTVVKIGNYLYFANTYKGYSSLTDGDNKTNKTELNSMYRTKLVDGDVAFNENGTNKNEEKVIGKIAGFEYSNIFVSGSTLFFTTPNIHKNSSSENRFDLVSLFKVNADGTGLKELLTTNETTNEFRMVKIDGDDYLLVRDGSNLYKIAMFKSNTKTTLVDNLTGIAFDKNENQNVLYYTTAREDNLSGNVLNSINVKTEEKKTLSSEVSQSFNLLSANNGTVYYTKSTTNLDAYYYYNDFSNGENSEKSLIYATSISEFNILDEDVQNNKIVTYIFQDNLYIDVLGNSSQEVVITSEDECGKAKNVLLVDAEYVYFLTEKGIFRVDYKQGNIQKVASNASIKEKLCDKVDNYFYFYSSLEDGTTYYLHRASLNDVANGNIKVQVVSQISDEEIEDIEETLEVRE